jgi:hypothetical protein
MFRGLSDAEPKIRAAAARRSHRTRVLGIRAATLIIVVVVGTLVLTRALQSGNRAPTPSHSTSTASMPTSTTSPSTSTTPASTSTTPASTSTTSTTTTTVPGIAGLSWVMKRSPGLGGAFADELSCPSVNFCAAVAVTSGAYPDATQQGLMVFNGTTWSAPTAEPTFSGSDVEVSCSEPSFCLAVSSNGLYTTWNGSSWSSSTSLPIGKTLGPSAISCTGPSFCMLVNGEVSGTTGLGTTTYATWTAGSGWSAVQTASGRSLSSVSCLGQTFCMAVGETTAPNGNGTVLTNDIAMAWNGSAWSAPMTVGERAGGISITGKVSCTSVDFCMAVGGYHASGNEYTLWNGVDWSNESPDEAETGISPLGFSSVSCPSKSLCVATDWGSGANSEPSTAGPPVISVWQAGTWSGTAEEALQGGSDVSCASANYCVIVGSGQYWIGT